MSATAGLSAHTPRVIWVVLDRAMHPAGVYYTKRGADANKSIWGTVVAYVPRRATTKGKR